jgi:hypothetical protein
MFETHLPLTSGAITMRNSPISAAALCLFVAALAAPLTAQGGGKKKHAADSTQPVTSDQTIKTDQTVNVNYTAKSDLTLKSDVTVSSGETPAEETTSNLHVPAFSSLPIALKWEFKDEFGYAELILFPDAWQIRGKYDQKKSDVDFEAVIALKDKSGNVFIFHHVYRAFKGRSAWGGQGYSPTLREWLPDLSKGFEVRGAYRFPTKAEGNAQAKADTSTACQTNAKFAAGWGSIWTWVEPHRQCFQFNTDY